MPTVPVVVGSALTIAAFALLEKVTHFDGAVFSFTFYKVLKTLMVQGLRLWFRFRFQSLGFRFRALGFYIM